MNGSINNNFINNNISNRNPSSYNGQYGVKDNNFSKINTASNVYPPNGGLQGGPNSRFNPLTTNNMNNTNSINNMNMTNFNKAFVQNTPIIDVINYENQNNLIHNNVGPNILDEHIVEYRINIDSIDRDIKTYPNPFDFTVKFNPVSNSVVTVEKQIDSRNKDAGTILVQQTIEGTPYPHINRNFKNVKYVKLDSVTLPQFSNIIKNNKKDEKDEDCEDEYIFDKKNYLLDDRFVVLNVKELEDESGSRILNTGDSSNNRSNFVQPFSLLYPDKSIGRSYYCATAYRGNKYYNRSQLGNINKLTIKFYDSCNKPLKYDNTYNYRQLEESAKCGDPISIDDIRHPLNKKTQVHLSFLIGVVESQISTQTKYNN